MGQSTNGILFYGILIEEDTPCPWKENEDDEDRDGEGDWLAWEDHYAALSGIPAPDVDYETDEEAHRKYWDAKRKEAEKSEVLVDMHCSGDYAMYYVALKSCNYSASRGYPIAFKNGLPKEPKDAAKKIKDFCKLMGIKINGKPAWHLTSLWM